MDEQRYFLQRYGSHLTLILVGFILLLGSQTRPVAALLDFVVRPEATAAAAVAVTVPSDRPTPRPVTTGAAAEIVVDLTRVPLLLDTSLAPQLDPATFQGVLPAVKLITYTVKRNDTPNMIAAQFDLEAETLLGCNPRLAVESSLLQVDDELIICPEDGVLHDVRAGETVESIAELYNVAPDAILNYADNNLAFPFRLYPETQLFVPGAVREIFVWTAPSLPSGPNGVNSPEVGGGYTPLVVGSGFYIWPVTGREISQSYWYGHPGIDISLPEGSIVVAADTGTVSFAGWNIYCYGNLIVVNHGNGFETFYAHLSAINVYPGQVVNKGSVIGAVGNTGCSSGPHLHFEIRENTYRHNPFDFLP